MKLFCFGFGYTASKFAQALPWEEFTGTHRDTFPLDTLDKESLKRATHILVSIPPDEKGDLIVREKYEMNPEWIGYLSTTGVYGNTDGAWVDEKSPLRADNARSKWRIKAEKQWLDTGLPVHIFRLSGIYGPSMGRNAIDDVRMGMARRIKKENQFFSRIHVDDITQVLKASALKPTPGEIFNVADDYPSAATEVVEYASKLVGIEPPPLVNFEDADMSEMARSFYMNSRRVKNDKIKDKLGIKLQYPTYKEGLNSIFLETQEAFRS